MKMQSAKCKLQNNYPLHTLAKDGCEKIKHIDQTERTGGLEKL